MYYCIVQYALSRKRTMTCNATVFLTLATNVSSQHQTSQLCISLTAIRLHGNISTVLNVVLKLVHNASLIQWVIR